MSKDFDELLKKVRQRRMSEQEIKEQKISFVYGTANEGGKGVGRGEIATRIIGHPKASD